MPKFTINIAIQERANVYKHFCRVEAGETEKHARTVLTSLRNRYPLPYFKVEMTRWDTVGTIIE